MKVITILLYYQMLVFVYSVRILPPPSSKWHALKPTVLLHNWWNGNVAGELRSWDSVTGGRSLEYLSRAEWKKDILSVWYILLQIWFSAITVTYAWEKTSSNNW